MRKLFSGIVVAVLGIVFLGFGFQYASLRSAGADDFTAYGKYDLLSAILIYGGVAIIILGIAITIRAIRKINADSSSAHDQ